MILTKKQQEDMSRQVGLKSRDIDICLFNSLDGSLPKDMLLDCLMMYQNNDGGFGHGLHIDNYNVNSSIYQVYEAFRLLEPYLLIIITPFVYAYQYCNKFNKIKPYQCNKNPQNK